MSIVVHRQVPLTSRDRTTALASLFTVCLRGTPYLSHAHTSVKLCRSHHTAATYNLVLWGMLLTTHMTPTHGFLASTTLDVPASSYHSRSASASSYRLFQTCFAQNDRPSTTTEQSHQKKSHLNPRRDRAFRVQPCSFLMRALLCLFHAPLLARLLASYPHMRPAQRPTCSSKLLLPIAPTLSLAM